MHDTVTTDRNRPGRDGIALLEDFVGRAVGKLCPVSEIRHDISFKQVYTLASSQGSLLLF